MANTQTSTMSLTRPPPPYKQGPPVGMEPSSHHSGGGAGGPATSTYSSMASLGLFDINPDMDEMAAIEMALVAHRASVSPMREQSSRQRQQQTQLQQGQAPPAYKPMPPSYHHFKSTSLPPATQSSTPDTYNLQSKTNSASYMPQPHAKQPAPPSNVHPASTLPSTTQAMPNNTTSTMFDAAYVAGVYEGESSNFNGENNNNNRKRPRPLESISSSQATTESTAPKTTLVFRPKGTNIELPRLSIPSPSAVAYTGPRTLSSASSSGGGSLYKPDADVMNNAPPAKQPRLSTNSNGPFENMEYEALQKHNSMTYNDVSSNNRVAPESSVCTPPPVSSDSSMPMMMPNSPTARRVVTSSPSNNANYTGNNNNGINGNNGNIDLSRRGSIPQSPFSANTLKNFGSPLLDVAAAALAAEVADKKKPSYINGLNGSGPKVLSFGNEKSRRPYNTENRPRIRGSYKCGECGFAPKKERHDCEAEKLKRRNNPNLSSDEHSGPGSSPQGNDWSGSDDQLSREQRMRGAYKCGDCGFYPKKMKHNCEEEKRKQAILAQQQTKPAPATKVRGEYKCGECGFMPKKFTTEKVPHNCEERQREAVARAHARRIRGSYRCGECGFKPKKAKHDCAKERQKMILANMSPRQPVHDLNSSFNGLNNLVAAVAVEGQMKTQYNSNNRQTHGSHSKMASIFAAVDAASAAVKSTQGKAQDFVQQNQISQPANRLLSRQNDNMPTMQMARTSESQTALNSFTTTSGSCASMTSKEVSNVQMKNKSTTKVLFGTV
eukprot:m.301413 g.301413  ORF g.301413 m.301413 type:complete len:777 (+) comp16426_c0_seq23:347-2677(+)